MPVFDKRTRVVLFHFLNDLAQNQKFTTKLNQNVNRIIHIQRKARRALMIKSNQLIEVRGQVVNGLNSLMKGLIMNKTQRTEQHHLIDILNTITTKNKESIEYVSRLYINLPSYIHAINLIRWYGLYRNKGVYNKGMYVGVMIKIKQIIDEQKELVIRGKKVCPTEQALRGIVSKLAKRRSGKNVD